MAIEALIFDVDGTLVDTNSLHARAWRQAFERFEWRLPEARILREIGKGGDRLVTTLVGQEVEDEHGEALRAAHNEIYMQLVEREDVQVFPGVRALFEAVRERGLKTTIATASKKDSLNKMLDRAGLDVLEAVDAVVTDDDVAQSKPHPDAVAPAARKLGLAPGQCAMIGDTPYDAEACLRAGLICLGVLTGVHGAAGMRRAGARASYADPAALLEHLDDALTLAAPGARALTAEHMIALMQEALGEAEAGLAEGEVPIGSVLVRGDGQIVGRGQNRMRATEDRMAHAEIEAFRQAAGQLPDKARDLVLVTTLEPCTMNLGAALEVGVDTIIYGLDAPDYGATRRCAPLDAPDAYMPRVIGGVRAEASRALLAKWCEGHPSDRFTQVLLAQRRA